MSRGRLRRSDEHSSNLRHCVLAEGEQGAGTDGGGVSASQRVRERLLRATTAGPQQELRKPSIASCQRVPTGAKICVLSHNGSAAAY